MSGVDGRVAQMPGRMFGRPKWWAGWRLSRRNIYLWLSLAPVLVLFLAVYGTSMVRVVLLSVEAPHWSLHEYFKIAADGRLWKVLAYSLELAAGVTAISLALSYPIALVMLRSSVRLQRILALLLIVPLWTSTLVRSFAWMVMLGRQGVVNEALQSVGIINHPLPLLYHSIAVYIGLVHVMLPFMVFPIFTVMRQIDEHLMQAARSLGAGRATAMACVFFPLTLPGIAVGCILVFVMTLGFWVTPTLLGGLADTTYVMVIETQVELLGNWPGPAAMSVILVIVTLVVLLLFQRGVGFGLVGGGEGRRRHGSVAPRIFARLAARASAFGAAAGGRASGLALAMPGQRSARRVRTLDRVSGGYLSWGITILAVLFLLAPIVLLIPISFSSGQYMQFPPRGFSFRWYMTYFSETRWTDPTIVSFEVAGTTMILATIVGTLTALTLARERFRFRGALLAFLLSPLIVPSIVLAVALYFQLAPFHLVATRTGLVLAYLILCTPYVIVVMMGTMQNFDYALERAARSLGAGPLMTFRRVVLPLVWPGIMTAALFAFLTAFDEVIIAVFLSGGSVVTLPKRLLEATRFAFEPTIAAVSVFLITISIIVVAVADRAQRHLSKQKPEATMEFTQPI